MSPEWKSVVMAAVDAVGVTCMPTSIVVTETLVRDLPIAARNLL